MSKHGKYIHCIYVRSIWEENNKPKVFKKSLSLTTYWKINCNRNIGSRDTIGK